MVPMMKAIVVGRKNAFATYSTATTQMISSATSANATTSARRITGGASALLSGTGVPSDPLLVGRSLFWDFWRSLGSGLEDTGLAGTGLLGATLTIVLPRAKRLIHNRNGVARALNSRRTTSGYRKSSIAEV